MAFWAGKEERPHRPPQLHHTPHPNQSPLINQLPCVSVTREREWGEEGELLKRQLLCTHLSSQGRPRHTRLLHGCESQALQGLTTLMGCTSLLCHYGAHLSPVSRCHDTTQAALSFPAWTIQASISPIHNFSNKTSTMGNHSVWMRLCISVPIFTSIFTAHERVFTAGH